MPYRIALATLATISLSGCVVKTAASVVTAPVKVVGKGVDMATTSQSEADEKRGREIRRREERLGRLQRDYDKQSGRCAAGDADACARRDAAYAEIQQILPTVPVEPHQ